MKKIKLVLFFVLFSLIAAQCAPAATQDVSVSNESEQAAPAATQDVSVSNESEQTTLPEITLWAKTGPEADALKNSALVYTRETGNPVNVVVVGRSGYRQKYNTALAAGSTDVDGILDISRVTPSLAAAGLLAPLTDYVNNAEGYNLDEIPVAVQEEMKMGDDWYMVPTDISEESYVYRTDLIPEPPQTWEELRDIAEQYTKDLNSDSPTDFGYAYAASPGTMVGTWIGIQNAYGAYILDEDGKVVVDNQEAIDALSFLVDMKCKDGVTPPDITAWDYPELLVGLQTGMIPQASFFTAGMPVLTDCEQSPDVCDKIAFAPQPSGPNGSFTRINPLGIMVNAASTKLDAVWAFLEWLTGPDGGKVYTDFGGTSPRESILSDEKLISERPWIPAVYEASVNGAGSLRVGRAGEINDVFNKWVDQATSCDISAEEALRNAAEELRTLLGE